MRYFAECNGTTTRLKNIQHDGHSSSKPDHFAGDCESCGQRHNATRQIEYKGQPSLHGCGAKCLNGSPRGTCECKCGGRNHGLGAVRAS